MFKPGDLVETGTPFAQDWDYGEVRPTLIPDQYRVAWVGSGLTTHVTPDEIRACGGVAKFKFIEDYNRSHTLPERVCSRRP